MENILNLFDRELLLANTSVREGEYKIGQTITLLEEEGDMIDCLHQTKVKFAILFVPEDIGVRGNHGRPGASKTWEVALKGICNLQDNYYLSGNEMLMLGCLQAKDLMAEAENLNSQIPEDLFRLRALTELVDSRLRTVLSMLYKADIFPIIIGGGHNNSYPNLTAWCDAKETVLNCINLDPHADYREMEGRHSGNGFRYAHEEGGLDRYAVVGLHEGYNSKVMVDHLRQDPDLRYSTFEDIAVRQILTFEEAVTDSLDFVSEGDFGIELDLDSIPGLPVSAVTPTGFSLEEARRYVHMCASKENARYLHICEGAAALANPQQVMELTKAIASLVADGIKAKRT